MHQTQKIEELRKLVEGADLSLQQAKEILNQLIGPGNSEVIYKAKKNGYQGESEQGQVVEGVFDGQQMIGPDGKQHSIPANYASKSKLVEGDLLKLTIDNLGNFIFKQIGPVYRIRLKSELVQDESTSEWRALAEGKAYKVLLASVTYFHGKAGDNAIILVPNDKSSTWAAIENIISADTQETDVRIEPYQNIEEDKVVQDDIPTQENTTFKMDKKTEQEGNLNKENEMLNKEGESQEVDNKNQAEKLYQFNDAVDEFEEI